jgi:hypothetical protein
MVAVFPKTRLASKFGAPTVIQSSAAPFASQPRAISRIANCGNARHLEYHSSKRTPCGNLCAAQFL